MGEPRAATATGRCFQPTPRAVGDAVAGIGDPAELLAVEMDELGSAVRERRCQELLDMAARRGAGPMRGCGAARSTRRNRRGLAVR
jgi:hypothetical protein